MEEKKMLEMSEQEFRDILEDLEKSNREQADYAKKTWIMTLISTISILVVVVFLLIYCTFLIPRINNMLNQAQVSLDNIAEISADISALDFEGLMGEVGGLVTTTEKDLNKTMEKIDEINIEDLNKSIKSLGDVIEPLADFFNTVGGKKPVSLFGNSDSDSEQTEQTDKDSNNSTVKEKDSGFSLFNILP